VDTTAGAETFTLHIVPSGGSADDTNKIYHEKSVSASETLQLTALVNQCIPQGATVHAKASTANALTLTISGRTQS